MFTWLGLIVTLLVWAGLALLLTRWHDRRHGSISAHGSSAPGAAIVFRLVLLASAALYYWWLLGWYVPHLFLPNIFIVLLTAVVMYQVATALNNTTSGLSKEVHSYTAQTMSLLYIPLAVLVVSSAHLSLVARILCWILLIYLVNSFVLIEVMKKFSKLHLVFQLIYIVVFQLFILASAYLS